MTEKLPVVVALVNSKGGVGKTTTAVNLAAALASVRRRVLLVDLDSQASASAWSGIRRSRLKPSAASARANLIGILITMAGSTRHGAAVRERLVAEYRDRLLRTEIPSSRALREAPGQGRTIFEHAPHSRAADAFRRLAGEVLERLRLVR